MSDIEPLVTKNNRMASNYREARSRKLGETSKEVAKNSLLIQLENTVPDLEEKIDFATRAPFTDRLAVEPSIATFATLLKMYYEGNHAPAVEAAAVRIFDLSNSILGSKDIIRFDSKLTGIAVAQLLSETDENRDLIK